MLRTGALAAAYWTIASHDHAFAASPPPPKSPTPAVLNRFPEMLQRHFAQQLQEAEARAKMQRLHQDRMAVERGREPAP